MKIKIGFSLIELILVVAIVLTLGVLSSGFYSRFLNQNSASNVSDQLASQLRKAQTYAMAGKQNTNWGVKYNASTVTLFAANSSAFDETFSVNTNINVSGFSQVIFTKVTGIPDSTPTITISESADSKTVSINSQGAVTR